MLIASFESPSRLCKSVRVRNARSRIEHCDNTVRDLCLFEERKCFETGLGVEWITMPTWSMP